MMTPIQARTPPPEVLIAVRYPTSTALLGLAAALLYTGSFFLPAADGMAGYHAFVLSLVFLIGVPMWVANPVFWSGLALLSQGKYRSARNAGLVALVLALSECWLFYPDLRVGYFAWVGSMALLAAAGWCGAAAGGDGPIHGPCGAREAARIAARFAGCRSPRMPSCGRDAYRE